MKYTKFLRTIAFTAFAMFFYSFVIMANADEFTFYVSPDGDNSWTGEGIDKPFATIQRARDTIRAIKKKSGLTKPVTVYIRGGLYELQETLVFKPEDSGSSTCRIQYVAYNGEKPVISGSKKITGPWKNYKGKIKVCTIDAVKNGQWYFKQLFSNGEKQTRARIPNKDFYTIDETEEDLGKEAFLFKGNDFKKWKNLNDIEVVLFHSWNESRLRISEVDEQRKLVTFTGRIGMRLGKGKYCNRYYIENVLKGLDQPGEWYLDRRKGRLYYWPANDLENLELRAPVVNELIRFEGDVEGEDHVKYIDIQGLTFSDTDYILPEEGIPTIADVGDIWFPAAITLKGASECVFKDNTIKNAGTYGLDITGDAIQVIGNTIYNTGSGGIITRSYGKHPNVIMFNHIHHCGDIFPSGVGINIDDGGGYISNNLVYQIGHSGIYARHWATNYGQEQERRNQEQGLIIEYNEIYDVMQRINDGGGIFIRDDYVVIRNNLIHDSKVHGIYLGCETRNCLVENNVVYRVEMGNHVWFKNRNNTISNNIFINGNTWQVDFHNPKGLQHQQIRFYRNIIYFSNPDGVLFSITGEGSLPMESDYNIIYHSEGKEFAIRGLPGVETFEGWKNIGFDTHSIITDPLFVDPENDDYSLKPESPAFKLGFKPIDLSKVGLRGYKRK